MIRRPAPRRALTLAVTLASALPGASLHAAEPADEIQTMVVTGSRIARSESESSTPLQMLSSDFIAQQGAPNMADILSELPAVGTPGNSRTNTNFAVNGNGVSTINLRNLDDDRTLVLINGRRSVSGLGGNSSVDINNIPADLVERVEVVTGGASAVYGSEAIAGVVNFILKDDFEGFRARTQWGRTSEEDNIRSLASMTFGYNFSDRGNVTLNLSYDRDAGLRSKNREISENDIPFRSSFVPQGLFFVGDESTWTYSPDNTLINDFVNGVNGFNRNAERYISVPVERKLITLLSNYELTDDVRVFFEGSYADVNSNARLEPLATDNSDAVLGSGTENEVILEGLSIENPFIPAAIRADMLANEVDILPFRKRLAGVFDRSNVADREFQRYVLGVEGSVFEDIGWQLYGQYSRTEEVTSSETALRDRYYYALDAIPNPAGGTPICRDAAARASGCVAFNPFGFNSHSSASADYIRGNAFDDYQAEIEQTVFGLNVDGALFALPAGDLRFAAGIEYRDEESVETYSEETRQGNTLSNALSDTQGDYDVTEAYLEVVAPIVNDLPFAQLVEVEGAVRIGDYSTVGDVLSWKAGATWQIDDNIRIRGVYAKATRAPNIQELFEGASQTFPSGLTDPCDGVTATSTGEFDAYCRTIPGIAAEIANNGVFEYDDNTDRQSIEGEDSGNPNLEEETAETWTIGLVLTPEFLPGLTLTVDYFNIEIEDAITLLPRQVSIDECIASSGTSSLCDLIVREGVTTPRPRTPGTVFQVNASPVNAAIIETRGYDLAARYSFDMEDGALDFALAYTYLSNLALQPSENLPVEDNKGQLDGDGRLGAGFEHRANASLTYTRGGLTATWRTNFLGRIRDTRIQDDSLLDGPENRISSFTYHDLQVRYAIEAQENYTLFFGIDNIFDKRPPLINQNGASHITGTETAADSYDPFGRAMYAGLEFEF